MGLLYLILAITFVILFFINVIWLALNIYMWATTGLQHILQGMNFVERIYASIYLKWMLLADFSWLCVVLIFLTKRKNYKTDVNLHYLAYDPIVNPKICVIIPAFNEESTIEKTVRDFIRQRYVENVIVVDNHSTDRTVEIAKKEGAKVITKDSNKGYAHSWFIGLCESLKTDANIIAVADSDGTYNPYDLTKMIPYLDNCDLVSGTRLIQVLTEKGNQNSTFYVWGNIFIAKLLQAKYFSVQHLGVIHLTDPACSFKCIRREALEKIIDKFTYPKTELLLPYANGDRITLFITSLAIENNLKVVEVPITFKRRPAGFSKSGANKKGRAIKYGLDFIWYILRS